MFDSSGKLDISRMQGAIPGESLTGMPGSKPWEKPTQFSDMNDLLEYFWAKFNDPTFATAIFGMLQAKTPADAIARTVLFSAFTKGICTVDMALLALPTLVRQLVAIGHFMGVKNIVIKSPDRKKFKLLSQVAALSEAPTQQEAPQEENNEIFSGIGL